MRHSCIHALEFWLLGSNPLLCWLKNHLTDFFQIQFIGIILVCRCAASWSLACQAHFGLPMGSKIGSCALRIPYLCNRWAESILMIYLNFFFFFIPCAFINLALEKQCSYRIQNTLLTTVISTDQWWLAPIKPTQELTHLVDKLN